MNSLRAGKFFMSFFLSSVEFFQNLRFQKILSGLEVTRVSNILDLDQARPFVRIDLAGLRLRCKTELLNVSTRGRLRYVYRCQALHISNKVRYQ